MKNLLIVLLLSLPLQSLGDEKPGPDELAKPVIDLLQNNELSNIASTALAESSISDYLSKSDMAQSDSQFEGILEALGPLHSSEVIHEQGIEGTFISRWYLLKFQRQPILMHMEFYKADKKWKVYSIEIDVDLDDYIEARGEFEIGKMGIQTDRKNQ